MNLHKKKSQVHQLLLKFFVIFINVIFNYHTIESSADIFYLFKINDIYHSNLNLKK